LNLVQPYLAGLKIVSNERVATNQDFRYVQQDIAHFQKAQAEKTATINESEAIKEKETLFKRRKAQDNERSARKPTGIKVYEITLKNADQPGLQEAGVTNAVNLATNDTGTNAPVALVSTNSSTNTLKSAKVDKAPKADKPAPPPFDPMLDETQRILLDYISMLTKNGVLMAQQKP
jgi:hypothetical protein